MAVVQELLLHAFGHHREGRRHEAEQLYRRVLEFEPCNVDAWHLLGVLASEANQHESASQCLKYAIQLKPDYAEAHYNLGSVRYKQGQISDAVISYRQATRLNPDYAEAHNNLGNALKQQGNLSDAEGCYRRVLEIRPDHGNALYNLGNVLKERGALEDAEACYRRAVELQDDLAEGWLNLGSILQKKYMLDAALGCFQRAVARDPELPTAHYCLGVAHFEKGNCDEAARCFQRAIQLNASYSHAWNDLGNALKELGQFGDAIASFRRAVLESPTEFKFHSNLAVALMDAGILEDAAKSFQRALALKPDSAEVRWNRSLLTLLRGDFERGWAEYEWRWQAGELTTHEFSQARWTGEPLAGRTILLHCEQGLGDTFQFIRYAAVLKDLGARVVVQCQRPALRVLANSPGIDELVGESDPLPEFDVHIPLLSVPGVLNTNLGSIPARVPYMFAESDLVRKWRARLEGFPGFRIGINWRGREGRGPFLKRNIQLECFAPLSQIPGVRLFSLQKGSVIEELVALKDRLPVIDFGEDVDGSNGAFVDTAAIIANLDLVITSDTSIPHLAGALGVPVWLALPYVPDWRWLLDRSDSPWYPTMRLFRQKELGDWAGVFAEMEGVLLERVVS